MSLADAVRETVTSGDAAETLGREVPAGYSVGLTAVVAVVAVVAGGVSVRGAALTLAGLGDLVTGRTAVEGRALRVRDRTNEDHVRVYIAVDDGSTDTIRAWLLRTRVGVQQGQLVRAQVTRWLRHAAEVEVARPVAAVPSGSSGPPAAPAPDAPASAVPGQAWPLPVPVATGGAVPRVVSVMTALVTAAAGTANPAPASPAATAGAPAAGPPADPPPTPPLPDDAAVAAAVGGPIAQDRHASRHPAALPGGSALYRSPTGDRVVQLAWIPAVAIGVYRALPPQKQRPIPGLGDEAYHARAAGALMARRGDSVLMVTVHAPELDPAGRDDLAARVAAAALAQGADAPTASTSRPTPPAYEPPPPPRPGGTVGQPADAGS